MSFDPVDFKGKNSLGHSNDTKSSQGVSAEEAVEVLGNRFWKRLIVGFRGVVQLRGSSNSFFLTRPIKVKAGKSFLFTEGSL